VKNVLSSVHDNASNNGIINAPTTSGTESVGGSIPISSKSSITSAESQVSKTLYCEVQNMPLCARTDSIKKRTIEKPIPVISVKKSSRPKAEIVEESLPMMSIDPSPSTIDRPTIASTDSVAITEKTKLDTKMTKRVAYLQVEIKMRPSRRVIHIPP